MKNEPAFPIVGDVEHDSGYHMTCLYQGLTVRDYFAAKAMLGLLCGQLSRVPDSTQTLANDAYAVADAMLKARSGK